MKTMLLPVAGLVLACVCALAASAPVPAQTLSPPHVLVISVDGMKPEYVTHAAEHGLQMPVLRAFLKQGTYADGVIGVVPTVTFPSHTTLLTGVAPAAHGIVSNKLFDPLGEHPGDSFWYFRQLRAQTIYQAAGAAGLKTGAVGWPVTLGAPIDYLLTDYNNPQNSGEGARPADIVAELHVTFPASADDDDRRASWAEAIIRKWTPNLMLVHFNDLDAQQHRHGPFSAEANAAAEHLDRLAGEVIAAEKSVAPDATVVVVSDHGFARVSHAVNLNAFFVQAGLITLKPEEAADGSAQVASWEAECWLEDGSAAVVLRDPRDKALVERVRRALSAMQADPANGVERVVGADELHRRGGFPEASFLIALKPGWATRGGFRPPFVIDTPPSGTHGYWPDDGDMRSAFFAEGPDVARGRDLGQIDMRQIAPTLAAVLRIRLPAAERQAVEYRIDKNVGIGPQGKP